MIDVGSIAFGPEVERQPILSEISRLRGALMPDEGSPSIEVVYFIPGSLGGAEFDTFEVRRSRSDKGRILVYVAVPPNVATSVAPMPDLIALARAAIEFGAGHHATRGSDAMSVHDRDALLASLAAVEERLSPGSFARQGDEVRRRGANRRVEQSKQGEASVTIRLPLGVGGAHLDDAFDLEDRLETELEGAGVGYVDGNDIGQETFQIFVEGPDVQKLRAVVEPVVRKSWTGSNGSMTLFDGDTVIAEVRL
jgi:hypothetical protein